MRARIPSHDPISKLVSDVFNNSGLRPGEFVLKLGYKNVNNGVAKLDRWIKEGTGTSFFLLQLIEAFHVPKDDIQKALEETKAIAEREEQEAERKAEELRKKNFVPWIYIETYAKGPRPGQIYLFALTGGQSKRIKLSRAFLGMDKDRAIRIVSWLVKRHYKKTRGNVAEFGPISGYRFVRTFEENILFDTEGRLLEVVQSRFKIPYSFSFSFTFKGRKEQTISILKGEDWGCVPRRTFR